MLPFTPIVAMFKSFMRFVGVGVLPLTLFRTMFVEMSISLWDPYRFRRLSISGRIYEETIPSIQSSASGQAKLEVDPYSYGFLFTAFRCIKKAHNHEKGLTVKVWIDFWCKTKFICNPPSCSHH